MTPARITRHVAGMPHLGPVGLSEDWALTMACDQHWQLLAESMGIRPSCWRDSTGERVYAAVVWLAFRDDPAFPLAEDDPFTLHTALTAIRKPYALSATRIDWGRGAGAEVRLLTGFVRREARGTNKKFATVRDIWTAPDHGADAVEALLDAHHRAKSAPRPATVTHRHRVCRLTDFNAADLFYFRNFARLVRVAEAMEAVPRPVAREGFLYGNAEDGQTLEVRLDPRDGGMAAAITADDGRCLFRGLSHSAPGDHRP
ncbi:MAG: hypothetical protein KF887_08020 [Paracoccaceae bacterium]|nr:MAG: hypothetical protein KF887_08020 [Paracoccaceae bacterium]